TSPKALKALLLKALAQLKLAPSPVHGLLLHPRQCHSPSTVSNSLSPTKAMTTRTSHSKNRPSQSRPRFIARHRLQSSPSSGELHQMSHLLYPQCLSVTSFASIHQGSMSPILLLTVDKSLLQHWRSGCA
uniref:Uncharacterized protein n=1 Tax=Laticauda laticaudata TaxID=8630 RepID=A0A8C5RZ99_LATLA